MTLITPFTRNWSFVLVISGLFISSVTPVSAQAVYQRLRAFGFLELSSAIADAPLTEGTNGMLYGLSVAGGQYQNGTVFRLNKDGSGFSVIKSFSGTNGDGIYPGRAGLLLATNGFLYGTTATGGSSNLGTIFRIDHSGSNYTVLKSFTGSGGEGKSPTTALVQAANGMLFGTTFAGGDSNAGTIFRINLDAGDYATLRSFNGGTSDGAAPSGALVQATNGMLFGTTSQGGTTNQGTVFTINLNGDGYQVLKSFMGTPADGSQPRAALVQGTDSLLYGTTYAGGTSNLGTVFYLNQNGSGYQVIKNFVGTNGANPSAPLVLATNGVFYGTTLNGGTFGKGCVFQINPSGSGFQIVKDYQSDNQDGGQPSAPVIQASDGILYGTTTFGGVGSRGSGTGQGTAFALNLNGEGYTVIWNFSEGGGDGVNAYASLVEATNGWLYSTTQNGGKYGQGTVFKMMKDGNGYTLLKSFAGTNLNPALPDGASPMGTLIQGTDGALYGTTSLDYTAQVGLAGLAFGNGTLFKLNLDGSGYQILKRFTGGTNGANPYAGLIQATNGALYGTTQSGGTAGGGLIFKINSDGGGFIVLTNFSGSTGTESLAALLQGLDGALYGITASGGSGGRGTVFKINLDGSGFKVLKIFTSADGGFAWAPLIQGLDGALYGMTGTGGSHDAGTVFRMNPNGTGFTTLKAFTGTYGDGRFASGGLVQARNGILYGTTSDGGANPPGVGTIFQLFPDGRGYAVLRSFNQDFYDGILPYAGLIQTSDGTLYGTTTAGGINQNGTIFILIPPAVVLVPVSYYSSWLISFLGIPDRTYTIERAPTISGPWRVLGSAVVGSNGRGGIEDLDPLAEQSFYRTTGP